MTRRWMMAVGTGSLVLITLAACRGRAGEGRPNRVEGKSVSNGHLLWTTQTREYPGEKEYIFVFDPVMGLLDIDSHRITDEGWQHLRAPDGETTALLIAPPFATLSELEGAIGVLSSKGSFKRVRVSVRPL